mmetsp:Transcript_7358/g.16867  ORF Transcript_7358/g.16867 Transcript_7358/m.16867 type:complete len:204 (-) Transcript_7358:1850-2461(-)
MLHVVGVDVDVEVRAGLGLVDGLVEALHPLRLGPLVECGASLHQLVRVCRSQFDLDNLARFCGRVYLLCVLHLEQLSRWFPPNLTLNPHPASKCVLDAGALVQHRTPVNEYPEPLRVGVTQHDPRKGPQVALNLQLCCVLSAGFHCAELHPSRVAILPDQRHQKQSRVGAVSDRAGPYGDMIDGKHDRVLPLGGWVLECDFGL